MEELLKEESVLPSTTPYAPLVTPIIYSPEVKPLDGVSSSSNFVKNVGPKYPSPKIEL